METILEAKNVTIRFGGLVAVNRVNIEQKRGEILALIGPNGAGKTTFFNLLTGVYQANEGTINFKGQDITNLKPYERCSVGIARTFQNIRLFKKMTVLENLLVANSGCNSEGVLSSVLLSKKMREKRGAIVNSCLEILKMVRLEDQQDTMAINLPYGKQRLLEIARALSTNPALVLLDEPGAGMNKFEKDELIRVIRYITADMKKDVLLIDHDMKFVMNISDRIVVLDYGVKIAEGNAVDIQNNPKVIEAYLGSGSFEEDEDGQGRSEPNGTNAEN